MALETNAFHTGDEHFSAGGKCVESTRLATSDFLVSYTARVRLHETSNFLASENSCYHAAEVKKVFAQQLFSCTKIIFMVNELENTIVEPLQAHSPQTVTYTFSSSGVA